VTSLGVSLQKSYTGEIHYTSTMAWIATAVSLGYLRAAVFDAITATHLAYQSQRRA
jgi:hypothetical protein